VLSACPHGMSWYPLQNLGTLCVKRETEIEECSGRDVTPHTSLRKKAMIGSARVTSREVTNAVFGYYNANPPRKHLPSFEAIHSNSDTTRQRKEKREHRRGFNKIIGVIR
jgi:hypothetical protein